MLAGADSLTELDTICSQVTEILHSGGFPLAKWASNRHNQSGESDASEEISIKIDEQSSVKTLGMRWAPQEDVFKYHLDVDSFASLKPTKRNILSIASRLFDPLGLLCAIVTKAKMLLQELWRLKVDWDEAIPMSLHTAWNKFITTLRDLHKISIPRYVCLDFYQQVQVHGFADASSHAYGCCIYIRTCNNKDVGVSLLTAKCRVAPLNVKTIPRLELCAALLLAKLWQQVSSTMTKFTIDSVNFWSDSQVTLYWLERDSCTLGTFVANRVAETQELSKGVVWRHVPTDSNPADLVSRGTDINEIVHWKTRIAGDDVQRQRNELRGSEQRAEGAAGGVSGEQGEADGVRSGESGAMEVYPSEGTALRRAVGSSSKGCQTQASARGRQRQSNAGRVEHASGGRRGVAQFQASRGGHQRSQRRGGHHSRAPAHRAAFAGAAARIHAMRVQQQARTRIFEAVATVVEAQTALLAQVVQGLPAQPAAASSVEQRRGQPGRRSGRAGARRQQPSAAEDDQEEDLEEQQDHEEHEEEHEEQDEQNEDEQEQQQDRKPLLNATTAPSTSKKRCIHISDTHIEFISADPEEDNITDITEAKNLEEHEESKYKPPPAKKKRNQS
ncbi:hypothetical protein ACLKA6_010159 [Drosophila palustris]